MVIYWLFVFIVNFVLHFFISPDDIAQSDGKYLVAIGVCSIVLMIVLAYKYNGDKFTFCVMIGAYVLRLFFLFWTTYCNEIFLLPNAGQDELTYYWNAYRNIYYSTHTGTVFDRLCLLLSEWSGLSLLYMKYICVLLSISAICVMLRTLSLLPISKKTYRITAAVTCFLPNFALLSSLLLREAPIYLLMSLSLCFFVRWWYEDQELSIAASILFSVASAWFHSGLITAAASFLCIRLFSYKKNGVRHFRFKPRTLIITASASVLILFFAINSGIGDRLGLTGYFRGIDSVEGVISFAGNFEEGGAAYNANLISGDNVFAFLINTPIHMLYFLFSPMPWDWRGLQDILTVLMSSLFYLFTVIGGVIYAFRSPHKGMVPSLILTAAFTAFVFGWGCSNAGTAMRHRDKLIALYLIIFAFIIDFIIQRIGEKFHEEAQDEIQRNRTHL